MRAPSPLRPVANPRKHSRPLMATGSRNAVVATCRAMGGAKRYRSCQGGIVSFIAPASCRRQLTQQEPRIRQPIGGRQISIVRLNDAAIVDGAIIAAVGLLLEYRL